MAISRTGGEEIASAFRRGGRNVTGADKVFAGSIPEFYDAYMVPLIFEAYAEDVAARVAAISPLSVLETAAGSGVVPRALINLLRPEARYVVTDLNQPMLDHAARRQPPGVSRQTIASRGARPTLLSFPTAVRRSMQSYASLARCSFRIAPRVTRRHGGS